MMSWQQYGCSGYGKLRCYDVASSNIFVLKITPIFFSILFSKNNLHFYSILFLIIIFFLVFVLSVTLTQK